MMRALPLGTHSFRKPYTFRHYGHSPTSCEAKSIFNRLLTLLMRVNGFPSTGTLIMTTLNTDINTHILGYPRIGDKRQCKFALEKYWAGNASKADVQAVRDEIFTTNIQDQIDAGLSIITVGDYAAYDLVLSQSVAFGVSPPRFAGAEKLDAFDRQFYFARGRDHSLSQEHTCADVPAWQMTKWFDTNYHYLVPELAAEQTFTSEFDDLLTQVADAQVILQKNNLSTPLKAVIVGPLSYLHLAKSARDDKLTHLEQLVPAYCELFKQLGSAGVTWVQVDEPILCLDLDGDWQQAFERTYNQLQQSTCVGSVKLLITSYFDDLGNNLNLACNLPVQGLHIDITRSSSPVHQPKQYVQQVIDQLPTHKVLSVGVVDGRSVWTTDQPQAQDILSDAYAKLGERLWVGSGCSLLHLPVDISSENVPTELVGKLAFAKQKLSEVVTCAKLATGEAEPASVSTALVLDNTDLTAAVREGEFSERFEVQKNKLNLPLLPTTTIGSFPQTKDIRKARNLWKKGELSDVDYTKAMQEEIGIVIKEQETLGLDVLVHGEPERTDMVEYFAEYLDGYWLSKFGWVQSYGTRCVRPPIVVGDISRPTAMTVDWIGYAQSQTDKYVKGMLTGPVTMLNWSFAPSDTATRDTLRLQLADAISQEVNDLQTSGVAIIQIDEAAFREGLPLKKSAQAHYWQQSVASFKHTAHTAKKDTQIHTHMCYSSFHDCINHIQAMDADVITIETARSGLQLLHAFAKRDSDSENKGDTAHGEAAYKNSIGPGVYDIHSPNTPSAESMQVVIDEAQKYIPLERLWVNPDCGLKTRGWTETRDALSNMVAMTARVRETVSTPAKENVNAIA